jgi:drug/metabolite transporter (DMT)-like permease
VPLRKTRLLSASTGFSIDTGNVPFFTVPMETERSATSRIPPRAIFFLVLTTVLWGGSFVFNKLGFRDIPPLTFAFYRFSLATLLMGILCIGRLPRLTRDIVGKGIKVGLALTAANLSFVLGLNETTVSRAGFLNNLFVLFVPLLGFVIWRDRISRFLVSGILLAVVGLGLLTQGGTGGFSRGDLFSTICALCIATHILAVSKILKEEDVYLVTLVQLATVAAISGALSFFFAPSPAPFGPVSLGALLYCAIFPTVLCFTLQNTWQRHTTPALAGLIYTLDPVWSLIGGMLVLGERLSGLEWTGCALIFAGVAVPAAIMRFLERRNLSTYRRAR